MTHDAGPQLRAAPGTAPSEENVTPRTTILGARPWALGVLLATAVAAGGALGAWWDHSWTRGRAQDLADVAATRQVASRLRAAGALSEAARLYESVAAKAALSPEARGTFAEALGDLYLELGRPEAALRWLYEAEATGGSTGAADVGPKIVHALERMGRPQAAARALADHTAIASHATDDPVVANIGTTIVHRSEVLSAMDAMGPTMAKSYRQSDERLAFLQQFVADKVLWAKAQKLQLHQTPQVQTKLEQVLRNLAVGKLLDDEVFGKIDSSDIDVRNHYDAHRDIYKEADFAKIKPRVANDLRREKRQEALHAFVQNEMTAHRVTLFADKMAP